MRISFTKYGSFVTFHKRILHKKNSSLVIQLIKKNIDFSFYRQFLFVKNKKKFLKRILTTEKVQLEKYYTIFFYRILPNIQKNFKKEEFLAGSFCNYNTEMPIKIIYLQTLITYEKDVLTINYKQKDILFVLWYIEKTIENCVTNHKKFKIMINGKEKRSFADVITLIWKSEEIKIQSSYLSNYIIWFEKKDGSSNMFFSETAD